VLLQITFSKCYLMMIKTDKLDIANEEVTQLQRLLLEAYERRRLVLINRNLYSWWDWVWEKMGY